MTHVTPYTGAHGSLPEGSFAPLAPTLDTGPLCLKNIKGTSGNQATTHLYTTTHNQMHTHIADRQYTLSLENPLVFRRELLCAHSGLLFLFSLWIRPTEQSKKL